MTLAEWTKELDQDEQGYVRQCFKFRNVLNGGQEPEIPKGMSKTKAEILKFHCKSYLEGSNGRKRKMDELETITFKVSPDLHKQLAVDAAQIDVNISIFIRTCIVLAAPLLKTNPELVNFFSGSVIPK